MARYGKSVVDGAFAVTRCRSRYAFWRQAFEQKTVVGRKHFSLSARLRPHVGQRRPILRSSARRTRDHASIERLIFVMAVTVGA